MSFLLDWPMEQRNSGPLYWRTFKIICIKTIVHVAAVCPALSFQNMQPLGNIGDHRVGGAFFQAIVWLHSSLKENTQEVNLNAISSQSSMENCWNTVSFILLPFLFKMCTLPLLNAIHAVVVLTYTCTLLVHSYTS